MYGQIEGKFVKAYLSFPGCSKLPTIHYRGDSAVACNLLRNCKNFFKFSLLPSASQTSGQKQTRADLVTRNVWLQLERTESRGSGAEVAETVSYLRPYFRCRVNWLKVRSRIRAVHTPAGHIRGTWRIWSNINTIGVRFSTT